MTSTLATPLSQIELTPGSAMRITGVTWESYLALIRELGENRATRITYDTEVLESSTDRPSISINSGSYHLKTDSQPFGLSCFSVKVIR